MLKRKKKRKKNKPIRRERERKKGGQFSFIYRNEVKNLMDSRSRGFIRGLDGRKLISREWIVLSFWNRSVRLTALFFAVIIRLLHMRYHINTYLFLSFYLLLLLFFFFFFLHSMLTTMFNCTRKDLFYKDPVLLLTINFPTIFLSSMNNLSFIVTNYPLCENKYGMHNELYEHTA